MRASLREQGDDGEQPEKKYRDPADLPEEGGPEFEGNPEHLAKLRAGVEAWNAWRDENPEWQPELRRADLSRANLNHANLSGANLLGANLSGAGLHGANLSGANLRLANLSGAELLDANLSGADLRLANLSGANLLLANLSGARLWRANLSGAGLHDANLSGADLRRADLSRADLLAADLSGADLRRVDLSRADLIGADLSGAKLDEADLSDADLRGVRRLQVDSNPINGAQFSPDAKDPWSVLRRAYTGPALIVNILLVALYFLPIIVSAAVLDGVSRAQQSLLRAAGDGSATLISETCSREGGSLDLPVGESAVLAVDCYSLPVWQMLLGFGGEGPWGLFMPALTALVIVYQLARFGLTQRVSRMRDAEERSGITPPRKEGGSRQGVWRWLSVLWPGSWVPRSYPNLYRIHVFMTWVLVPIVIAAFLLRGFEFATTDIIRRGEPPPFGRWRRRRTQFGLMFRKFRNKSKGARRQRPI